MARCFYCGKKSFRGINWPIHPKDGRGNCCKECWRSKVAEVGLTKATGDRKLDFAASRAYANKAEQCFAREDYEGAVANLDKYFELCLKSKQIEHHYSWYALRGDCHMRLGHVEKAKNDLSTYDHLYISDTSLYKPSRDTGRMQYLEYLKTYNPQVCALVCSLLDEIVATCDLEGSAGEELCQGLEKELYLLPPEGGLILYDGFHIPMSELHAKDPVRYFTYLGVSYLLLGKFKKAIKRLEKLVEVDPKNAGAYYFLGSARVKQFNEVQARGGIFSKRKLRSLKNEAKNDFLTALFLAPSDTLASQIEKQNKKLGEPPLTTRYMHILKRANCTRCGAELKPHAKFCHICGQKHELF